MTHNRCLLLAFICSSLITSLAADELQLGGHLKSRYTGQHFPDDSLIRQLTGSTAHDLTGDARINLGYDQDRWDLRADYQLTVLSGDTIEYTRQLQGNLAIPTNRLADDRRRLLDLTHVIRDRNKTAALHRLDRMSIGFTGTRAVARLGRQAVSWGNGMIYSPMDIFNPFDPTAVDTEYKSGDDMFYGQYLHDSGDDTQAVAVFRRDIATGDFETEASSLALKYHGMTDAGEYDALAAVHYDDVLLATGGNMALGGAIWRGDITLAFADQETTTSVVTSLSYSWTWAGKNISGMAEYFFNGFGQRSGHYDPVALADNPDLLNRVARRELFTLGRHYIAVSAMIEVTPLFLLTPNIFINTSDNSALLQIIIQNDLHENLALLSALNVPVGPSGTEFGGIDTGLPGQYLSTDPGIFTQLAWYF